MRQTQPEPGERNFHVCLFGASLDTGNMGCRALGVSLVGLIHALDEEAKIYLLYGAQGEELRELEVAPGRRASIRILNFRLSPKARYHEHLLGIFAAALAWRLLPFEGTRRRLREKVPWLRCLLRADLVGDVRGGDSFSDIYGMRRYIIEALPGIIAWLLGKQPVFLPQTYGPYRRASARALARFTLRRARAIFARDARSLELARELAGAKGPAPRLCPDVAFSLEPIPPEGGWEIDPPLPGEKAADTLVGLNVSGLLYMGGYSGRNEFGLAVEYPAFVSELINRLLAEPGVRVLLTPHTFGSGEQSDHAACGRVWESLDAASRERVHLVTGDYDQNAIKALIGRCDFFLGSRMHSTIAALSQCVPAVGLAYSRKFAGVFDSVGVGELVVDLREGDSPSLLEDCLERLSRREAFRERLAERIPRVREELSAIFREAVLAHGADAADEGED